MTARCRRRHPERGAEGVGQVGRRTCAEGAEKELERFEAHHRHESEGARNEKLVFGAIRTELILSTEILLISLANLGDVGRLLQRHAAWHPCSARAARSGRREDRRDDRLGRVRPGRRRAAADRADAGRDTFVQ